MVCKKWARIAGDRALERNQDGVFSFIDIEQYKMRSHKEFAEFMGYGLKAAGLNDLLKPMTKRLMNCQFDIGGS